MDRPRRDSRQHNGITLRGLSQPTFATKSAITGSGKASVAMACRGPCDPRLVRDHADHFASCAARYASASFFSSSAVNFGGSTEIVSLLILPVNANGI